MSFEKTTHNLHKRRMSRNVGVFVVLAAFVAIVFGLTVVKVSNMDTPVPGLQQSGGN